MFLLCNFLPKHLAVPQTSDILKRYVHTGAKQVLEYLWKDYLIFHLLDLFFFLKTDFVLSLTK